MERQLVVTRAIAAVLAVLLAIAVVIILNDRTTIADLKAATSQNLTIARDTIRADCQATDPASQGRCAEALQSLTLLLVEFSQRLPGATSTAPR